MLVEQALFTSAQTRHTRGYHLVAKSPGVPDRLAQLLAVWGPTHDSLVDPNVAFSSLNYFLADGEWAVLSRTVYGQSEYSGRGGFRVETNLILFRREQLAGFAHNPVICGRSALSLGYLRLRNGAPAELPPLSLPEHSVLRSARFPAQPPGTLKLSRRVLDIVPNARVAVIGCACPLAIVTSILAELPEPARDSLSFTTGLKPSLHRRFDLQFLPAADAHQRRELAASGVTCLDA